MRLHQPVGRQPADEEAAGEDPERAVARGFDEHLERAEEVQRRGRGRDRVLRRALGLAIGAQADITRVIAHEQRCEHRDDRAGDEDRDHRVAPAQVLDHPGRDRQEDQLPGGCARGEQADDQAAALGEPAARDHRTEHQRRQAGAATQHQAPQHEQLPELRDLRGQHHRDRDEAGRGHHDAAQPETRDEDRRERPEQAEQREAHREHRRELVGGPAEFLAERLQHRARQPEGRRGGQHREERDGRDHPRVVDTAAWQRAGNELGQHGGRVWKGGQRFGRSISSIL